MRSNTCSFHGSNDKTFDYLVDKIITVSTKRRRFEHAQGSGVNGIDSYYKLNTEMSVNNIMVGKIFSKRLVYYFTGGIGEDFKESTTLAAVKKYNHYRYSTNC